MNHSHLELGQEFPEFREKISELKTKDNHFKKLYDKYTAANREIEKIEKRVELISEEEEIEIRKTRLSLKDQLYSILSSKA